MEKSDSNTTESDFSKHVLESKLLSAITDTIHNAFWEV
jgi:hypothetical protein